MITKEGTFWLGWALALCTVGIIGIATQNDIGIGHGIGGLIILVGWAIYHLGKRSCSR